MKLPRIKSVGGCLAAILIAGCGGINNSRQTCPAAPAPQRDTKVPSRVPGYSLSDDRSHRLISDGLNGETFTGTAI